MPDQGRLTAALADYLGELRQRRWYVNERYWERPRLAFVHGKKRVPGGTDEILVIAEVDDRNRIKLRRYALLKGRKQWLRCDWEAFEGLLEEGPRGLKRGRADAVRTTCRCKWKIHLSSERAVEYAQRMARHYSNFGVQRPYRCQENPLAYHLTTQQKGSRARMPGARPEPGSTEGR